MVIKLEGGTDADIEAANEETLDDESVLDLLPPEQLKQRREEAQKARANEMATARKSAQEGNGATEEEMAVDGNDNQKMEFEKSQEKCKGAQLYKTRSIHFRSVPANVPLNELEMVDIHFFLKFGCLFFSFANNIPAFCVWPLPTLF